MRTAIKWLSGFIIANLLVVTLYFYYSATIPPQINTLTNFDITYDDPRDDVVDSGYHISGKDDIDIVQLKSRKSKDNLYLILELKVVGRIVRSMYFHYNIYLMDEEEEYFEIMYSNGYGSGYYWDSDLEESVDVGIKNSNTLVFTIPLEISKDIMWYDLSAGADCPNGYDSCDGFSWDNLIIEPISGSTVYGNCTIKGITDPYNEIPIDSVYVQINNQFPNGWKLTITNDNWTNWSHEWDTRLVSDRKITIYARAIDIKDRYYYFDKITVTVEQKALTNPKTTNTPINHIGDFNYYEGGTPAFNRVYNSSVFGPYFGYEILIGENMEFDTISINGTIYDTYIRKEMGEFSSYDPEDVLDSRYKYERKAWFSTTDQAALKVENYWIEINDSGDIIDNRTGITSYEYLNNESRFPLMVGKEWNNTIIERDSISNYNESSEEFDIRNYTHKYSIEYHCIGTDEITVPAGTFEVFIIVSRFNVSSYQIFENNQFKIGYNKSDYYYDHYIVEYYSSEIGGIIKVHDSIEEYGPPHYSLQLVAYKYGNDIYEPEYINYSNNPLIENVPIVVFSFISLNSILLSTMFITGTEVGKYGFLKLLTPLLAKRKKKRNYELGYIKGSVRGVIFANPGENYSSIKKILKLPNGTLTYYLKALEKERVIRSERDGFLKRFYPAEGSIATETLELSELQKNIYEIIQQTPGSYQKDIQARLDISQQRLNYHIQLMVDARILKVEIEGNKSRYYVLSEV
jgi:DNA-binding transcriptional ArsR family regulator